ncbi:MAG: hypothetical protein OSB34_16940 [Planktomarina sp.]|nr:hypothetical protein [Planktomarina sp.]
MSVNIKVKSFEELDIDVQADAGLTYHKMLTDSIEFAPMNHVAASLAYNLYEAGEVWDWDERRMVKGNTLQYAQNSALNGICYTLNMKINDQRGKFNEAGAAAVRARSGATSQNGAQQYQNKVDAVRRAEYQLINLISMFQSFSSVHSVALGRDYKFIDRVIDRTAPAPSEHEVDLSAIDAQLASSGFKVEDHSVTSSPKNDNIGPLTEAQAVAEYLSKTDPIKPMVTLNTDGVENVEEAENEIANRQIVRPVAGSAQTDPRMEDASIDH